MTNERIVFDSIKNSRQRSQFCNLVDELIRLCPSDSVFRAYCGHRGQKFFMHLRVISQTTQFCAAHQARDFAETLEGLKSAMLAEIHHWRRERFAS